MRHYTMDRVVVELFHTNFARHVQPQLRKQENDLKRLAHVFEPSFAAVRGGAG